MEMKAAAVVVALLSLLSVEASSPSSSSLLNKEEEETLFSCYNLATSGAAKREPVVEDVERFLDAYLAAHPEDTHQPVLILTHDALDDEYAVKTALRKETTLKGPNIYAIGKKVKARLEEKLEEGEPEEAPKKVKKATLVKEVDVNKPPATSTTPVTTEEEKRENSAVVSTMVLVLGPLSGAAIILTGFILFYLLRLKPRLDSKPVASTIATQ